ncbi:MAG: HD-GYP domain-containing protein [Planctomycetota bacterium]|jgi:putative two-component system response regulator
MPSRRKETERSERASERGDRPASGSDPAALIDAIFGLARASGLLDVVAGAHVIRIRRVVEQIAGHLGESRAVAEKMGYDAMLHDVGKLAVPHSLLAAAPLDEAQRRALQQHTSRGHEMLCTDESLAQAAQIARHHHESWDGSGYPDGLQGDSIPLAARITAVADALDDLLCGDEEHERRNLQQGVDDLTALAGACFDPVVIEALRMCHADGALDDVYDTPPRRADAA